MHYETTLLWQSTEELDRKTLEDIQRQLANVIAELAVGSKHNSIWNEAQYTVVVESSTP